MSRQTDASVQTLRGIAIVLMTAGHVIGADPQSGMRAEGDHLLRYIYYSLEFLRLPLFTTISGFVYAMRPLSEGGKVLGFMQGKVRRLLIPMATVGTVEYLARALTPGINSPVELSGIWRIYFFGFDHFWFLQSIFLIFLGVALTESLGLMSSLPKWLGVLLLCCVINRMSTGPGFIFSSKGAAYLCPFLVLGIGLYRFPLLSSRPVVALGVLGFVVGVAYQQWSWFRPEPTHINKVSTMAMLVSVSGMIVAFNFRKENGPLARLGKYAFGIYLFHVFGTAPGRILAYKVGLPDTGVFVVSLLSGLTIGTLIEQLCMSNRWSALLLLGLRLKPHREARSTPTPQISSG